MKGEVNMIFTTEYRHSYKGSFNFVWAYIEQNEKGEIVTYNLKELLTNTTLQKRLQMRVRNTVSIVEVAKDILLPDIVSSDLDSEDILIFQGDSILQRLMDDTIREDIKEKISRVEYVTAEWVDEEFDALVFEAINCLKMIEERQFVYKVHESSDNILRKAINKYNTLSQGSFVDYTKAKQVTPYTISYKETDEVGFALPRVIHSTNEDEMQEYLDSAVLTVQERIFNFNPYGSSEISVNYLNYKDIDLSREQLFGNPSNNYLELQDNEKRFYNDLIDLINKSTEDYCKITNTDLEYTRENCIFKNTPLETVFKTMIRIYVNINWSQSKYVPNNEFSNLGGLSNTEESEESEGPITDGVSFMFDERDIRSSVSDTAINYYNRIVAFMLSNKPSIYALAELVIKLARWGSRKPEKITLNFPLSRSIDRYELDPFTFEKRTAESRIVESTLVGKNYLIKGVVRSRLPAFQIDGSDNEFSQLGVEPFTDVKDIIIGVILGQPYKIGDEDRNRDVAMDLPTLIRNADRVLGLKKNEEGVYQITNEEGLADNEEDLVNIVNNNVTSLGEVYRYINSKDRSQELFVNDNKMYLDFNKDLTSEELKVLNFMDYLNLLTQVPELKVINNPKTEVMKIFKIQSKMYLNYISDNTLMHEMKDYEPNLNDALELFAEHYMEEIPKQEDEDSDSQHTNLFSSDGKETFSPVYIFQIDKNHTYLVTDDINQEQKKLGCKAKMFKYDPDKMKVDSSKIKAHVKGYRAFKNIVIILMDEEYKQGIYTDYEERHNMMELVERLLKTRDLSSAERILTMHIKQQTSKNKK